jgi:hypothetical protein
MSRFCRHFLVVTTLIFLSGCNTGTVVPARVTSASLPVTAPSATALPEPSRTPVPAATATKVAPAATVAPAPTVSNSPTSTPAATKIANRLTSGWGIYSNPDYVEGVAIQGTTLWAATLGGVLAWNLDNGSFTLYSTRDGLDDIQANDVVYCPTPKARVYVAHETGSLSVYDLELKKWSRIPISFEDGSTLKSVQTLFCDQKNHRLLLGSGEGLGILDLVSGDWQRFGPEEGLKLNEIRAIDVIGQTIWVAAGDDSAFMIMGRTIFPFSGSSGFPNGPVNDLASAPDSTVWFAYPNALVHYAEGRWKSYGSQTLNGIPFQVIDHVEIGAGNTIWIAGSNEGACPFNTITFFCSIIYPANKKAPITDMVVDSQGVAYAGTEGMGVMVMDKDDVHTLSIARQQLLSNDVTDITEGLDGKLWIATDRGMNIIDPNRPTGTWDVMQVSKNELAFPQLAGVRSVTNGMWFWYSQQSQASFFDGQSWKQFGSAAGITAPVLDVAVDSRGYTWFATAEALDVWDGSVMRSYGPSTGLPGNEYRALLPQGNTMWIGTDRGLLEYERYQWITAIPEIPVNAILRGKDQGLLLGTDQGLLYFDGSQSYFWVINLGDEIFSHPRVTTLDWDKNNNLWVGTDGDGLFYFNGKTWDHFTTSRGLPTNSVRKVFTDQVGAVWIATVTGHGGGALVRFMP